MSKNIKKIAIAGAGGLGSHLTGMLFDFGVNRQQFPFTDYVIDIYDDDVVDMSNLLHQNYTDNDLHKMKVNCMADRYVVNPIAKLMVKEDFPKYDVIFCGVDSMTFRKELYNWTWSTSKFNKFWIDGRCESRQGCVFNSTLPKSTLEKMLSDSQERTGCLRKFEKENKISHALPVIVAGMMLQTFLNYIRGEENLPEKIFMV